MYKKITLYGIATVIVILAVCTGTVTAYSNYDAIWTSSGNQFIEESLVGSLASTPNHYPNVYQIVMAPKSSTVLITPFVNSISKTGVHPKVRYLYYELNMPTVVSVTYVAVYSGPTLVYSHSVSWAGTGAVKDYTLDMGSYHDMVRGINTEIDFSNSKESDQIVNSYGAGAKQEW